MTTPSGGGLYHSLRRLVDTAVDILQVRLQLLGSEIEQEKVRLVEAMVQAAIGLVMVALSLVLVLGFVVLLFWEGYRLPAIGVLTLVFAGGGAWLLRNALAKARGPEGGPFALSLSELRRDREGLRREPPAP